MIAAAVIAVLLLGIAAYKVLTSGAKVLEKPPHFREPIAAGCFRLIAVDEVGGAELARAVGDHPSFEEAFKQAAAERADSELRVGHKGQPTKFFIYDHAEELVGDWKGRKT